MFSSVDFDNENNEVILPNIIKYRDVDGVIFMVTWIFR